MFTGGLANKAPTKRGHSSKGEPGDQAIRCGIGVGRDGATWRAAPASGCIRLTNEDVSDLYSRVHVGTKVIVMPMNQRAENPASKRS